jgi:hypothetical protein
VDGIDNVPAIDDGVSDTPFECQDAFLWVMKRCYAMLQDEKLVKKKLITKELVASIHKRIENLVRDHSRVLNGK